MLDLLKQIGKKDVLYIDSDLGFELCRREGIAFLVSGSLTKAGDTFMADVKILDSDTRNLIKGIQSRGRGKDSILDTQIDELSRKILMGLGTGVEEIEATRLKIADVTTSSMEAYELYLQGKDLYGKMKRREAREAFEKAVQIDPSFASVYRILARLYGGLKNYKERDKAIEKALSLSDQVTEKERLKIEAYAERYRENSEKYIYKLEEIIKMYPNDKQAYSWLGSYLATHAPRSMRDYNRATKEYEKVLELDPDSAGAYLMLGIINYRIGNFDKALELLEKYRSLSPGSANPYDTMAHAYFFMGKLDKAISYFKEAININPDMFQTYWCLAYVYSLK
jgi:tetratricopeptide (TPR) repeat protein